MSDNLKKFWSWNDCAHYYGISVSRFKSLVLQKNLELTMTVVNNRVLFLAQEVQNTPLPTVSVENIKTLLRIYAPKSKKDSHKDIVFSV